MYGGAIFINKFSLQNRTRYVTTSSSKRNKLLTVWQAGERAVFLCPKYTSFPVHILQDICSYIAMLSLNT